MYSGMSKSIKQNKIITFAHVSCFILSRSNLKVENYNPNKTIQFEFILEMYI